MISAPVRVIAVQDRVARVEPTAKSGCGGCASREACGVSGLGKFFASRRKSVTVQCDERVRAGDELQVQLHESDLLLAGLMAYLLPSGLALVGAVVGSAYGSSDAAAAFGAGIGCGLGFVMARLSGWVPRLVVQGNSYKGDAP